MRSVVRTTILVATFVVAARAYPQATGIAIDDSLFQPIQLPSTMAFGYPPNETYLPRFIELIRQRQFDSLDTIYGELAADVRRDVRNEVRFADAFAAADRTDPAIIAGLDAWVAARPTSAHAHVARARYHLGAALRRRGTDARSTVSEDLRVIRESAKKGIADITAALDADSTHLVAYQMGIGVLLLGGMPEEAYHMMVRGLSFHPGSYTLPRMLVTMMGPRWGGSEEMMEQSQNPVVLEYYGRTLVELSARARPEIRPTILQRAVEVLSLAAYLDPTNARVRAALERARR